MFNELTKKFFSGFTVGDLDPILIRLKTIPLKDREIVFRDIARTFEKRLSDVVRQFDLICRK